MAPTGPKPVVTNTGKGTGAPAAISNTFESMFSTIVAGVNEALPGGGGFKTPVGGNPALIQAPNGGKSLAPAGNLFKGGVLPTGVIPGVGYVGNQPKGGAAKGGAPVVPPPTKLRIKGRSVN